MKILFIVPYAPTRILTRPHYFIRNLARKGHQVTLATVWENGEERRALETLAGWGVRVVSEPLHTSRIVGNLMQAAATGLPLQARYSWSPRLALSILDLLREGEAFDVVHVEHLRGAAYGTFIRRWTAQNPPELPIIWDSVDSISYLFEQSSRLSASRLGRVMARLELGRTRRHEARLVGEFDRVLVTSDADKAALSALHNAADERIWVLPNGVDFGDFAPGSETFQPDSVVFTGKMSYHANHTAALHFARKIMPLVWEKRPQAEFWIVGKDPGNQVSRLAEDSRIRVFGTVPDIAPILANAAVSVAPMSYGAGIQNKVLEAMACKVPVVCTPQAASALSVKPGTDLLVSDTPEAFAASVIRLLENGDLRWRIAQAGHQYVLVHHNWEEVTSRLEDVYLEIIDSFL